MQRLNRNLEAMRPDIHTIAQGIGSTQKWAQASEKFTPQDVNRPVLALDRASSTGENLYQQLWGKK